MQFLPRILFILWFLSKMRIYESSVIKNSVYPPAENSPLCIFLREKDKDIDKSDMPSVMVFCSCVVVSTSQVLTARSCFVQEHWLIYKIATEDVNINTAINSSNSRKIVQLTDLDRITLIKYSGSPLTTTIPKLKSDGILENCMIHSHGSFNNVPLNPLDKKNELLSKMWTIDNWIYTIPVHVEEFGGSKCSKRFSFDDLPIEVPPRLNDILCVTSIQDLTFDLCATDLGAPIICSNNTLMGIIYALINRPYTGIQTSDTLLASDFPSSCYTSFDKNFLTNNVFYVAEYLKTFRADVYKLNRMAESKPEKENILRVVNKSRRVRFILGTIFTFAFISLLL